jgi:hypothetical protein
MRIVEDCSILTQIHTAGRKIMKIAFGAPAALLLASIAWSAPAEAQGVPGGSYLQSCGEVGMQGDTLFAVCRTMDGRGQRAQLPAVSQCVGDIGNNNGNLNCNYAGAGPPPGQQPYGQQPPPGYGYGPPR